MDKRDICNACGDIVNDVVEAINRNDYSELNRKINDTVNGLAAQIKTEVNQNFRPYNNGQYNARPYNNEQSRQSPSVYRRQDIITTRPAGRIAGVVQMIGGIVCTSGFGIAAFVMLILALTLSKGIFGVLGAVFIVGVIVGISNISGGTKKLDLVKRFRRYVSLIGTRDYVEVKELADATGMPKYKIVRDLELMIKKNMFLQGGLDKKKTTLMLTQDVYRQYIETEKWNKAQANGQTQNQTQNQMQEQAKTLPPQEDFSAYEEEVRKILMAGNEYIAVVRKCNDDIPNEQVSDKLYRLENIMSRIFEQVKKNPESAAELHQLMDYYLPTTIKLLNAYIDLDRQNIAGENIDTTKREIEEVLDTINLAFEKLLDSMFENTAWDISSDISVMKTMMKQEGLTENNDFKGDK